MNTYRPTPALGCTVTAHERMFALIASFPSLRKYEETWPSSPAILGGDSHFEPAHFEAWARGAHATGGSRWAARFVLDVWNGYSADDGKCIWKIGRFSIRRAFDVWDSAHRAAFLAWVNDPDRVCP